MNRKAARALAKSTLEGLNLFQEVFDYAPEAFTRCYLVATVQSKSLGFVQDARELFSSPAEIWVSICVRRAAQQLAQSSRTCSTTWCAHRCMPCADAFHIEAEPRSCRSSPAPAAIPTTASTTARALRGAILLMTRSKSQ